MTSGQPSAFIDVRRVHVNYPVFRPWWQVLSGTPEAHSALRDVSFTMPLGATATVFGREGSGKTTLLRLLTGIIKPARGKLLVNGASPLSIKGIAAGYVSPEENENIRETGHQVLSSFASAHAIDDASAKITQLSDTLSLSQFIYRTANSLSSAQRLRLNLARAALSHSPLILLDDVADGLGVDVVKNALETCFAGRTVLASTRFPATAEALNLPLLLLHNGQVAHMGTLEDIAQTLAAPRLIDVWIEGLRYDVLRNIRRQSGVIEARLMPTTQFSGQKLRIHLQSGRYLPSLYDSLSQAPLIRVEEIPPSLHEIITRL